MVNEAQVTQGRSGNLPDEGRDRGKASVDEWFPSIYDCLRDLAERRFRWEAPGHTFQPTVLVHEAYVRLARSDRRGWRDRTHLLAVAARTLREILIDHARRKASAKRGGGRRRVALEAAGKRTDDRTADLLALDEALSQLARDHERASRVVELRYFSGLTIEETAEVLEVSASTVKLDWRFARAWLHHELHGAR